MVRLEIRFAEIEGARRKVCIWRCVCVLCMRERDNSDKSNTIDLACTLCNIFGIAMYIYEFLQEIKRGGVWGWIDRMNNSNVSVSQ